MNSTCFQKYNAKQEIKIYYVLSFYFNISLYNIDNLFLLLKILIKVTISDLV